MIGPLSCPTRHEDKVDDHREPSQKFNPISVPEDAPAGVKAWIPRLDAELTATAAKFVADHPIELVEERIQQSAGAFADHWQRVRDVLPDPRGFLAWQFYGQAQGTGAGTRSYWYFRYAKMFDEQGLLERARAGQREAA